MNATATGDRQPKEQSDDYRSFLLLEEISRDNRVTQRALSKRLGLALGLVNSYIRNLTAKGYITVSTIPPKRYAYYLTPKGLLEKTRLTYHHLQHFTHLYKVARQDFQRLFCDLYDKGVRQVLFCGVDEVTEIAYLSLQEVDIELVGIVDGSESKKIFFRHRVASLGAINDTEFDVVVITSFASGDLLKGELVKAGVPEEKICNISSGGWLGRGR
ncbi:MAG: winged helix-turn-helix transcriptional regulator [Thermodesulfobacteriota bacterium]